MRLTDLNPAWIDAGGEGITRADTGEPVPHQRGVAALTRFITDGEVRTV